MNGPRINFEASNKKRQPNKELWRLQVKSSVGRYNIKEGEDYRPPRKLIDPTAKYRKPYLSK